MGYPTCLSGYLDPYAYPVWGVPAIAGTESELLHARRMFSLEC